MRKVSGLIALVCLYQVLPADAQFRRRGYGGQRYQRSSRSLSPLQKKYKERFGAKEYQDALLFLNGLTRTPRSSSPGSLGGALSRIARDKMKRANGNKPPAKKKSNAIGGGRKHTTSEERNLITAQKLVAAVPTHVKNIKVVAAACRGEFKDIKNKGRFGKWDKSFAYQCKIAREWKAAFTIAAAAIVDTQYANLVKAVNRAIKMMESDEGYVWSSVAKFFISPRGVAEKLNMTAEMIEGLLQIKVDRSDAAKKAKTIVAATTKTLNETAGSRTWPRKKFPYREKRAEKIARKTFKEAFKGAVIKKTGIFEKRWHFEKNGLGIILNRYRTGAILLKLKGEKWCRRKTFKYTEPRKTGNRYRKSESVWIFRQVWFQQCK